MPTRCWLPGIACTLAAAALGGCTQTAFFLYLIAPEPHTKAIPAEYDDLSGGSVAVVVFADDKTQSEHRNIQLDVCSIISVQLRKNVKDVTIISPRRVVKYQRENLYWEELDRTKLGRDLGAGYVLYISLDEFATLEAGSLQLFRGRVTATASVYKSSLPARDARVWGPKEIRVIHPAEAATGQIGESDATIRHRTLAIFADHLVKKFYKHKPDPPQ